MGTAVVVRFVSQAFRAWPQIGKTEDACSMDENYHARYLANDTTVSTLWPLIRCIRTIHLPGACSDDSEPAGILLTRMSLVKRRNIRRITIYPDRRGL